MKQVHGFEVAERSRRVSAARSRKVSVKTLERQLSDRVVERFSHACGAIAIVAKVGLPALEQDQDVPANPGHPLCTREADSDYCRESWQLHLAELRSRPQILMHRCKYRRLCAVVPVVFRGRCIAATKLVCPPNESEVRFRHLVGVLDSLVRDYVAAEGEALQDLGYENPSAKTSPLSVIELSDSMEGSAAHPLIRKAMRYIEENVSDPDLTVRKVAEALGVNTNYLSHIFAKKVGQRMGLQIIQRRVESAQLLLATTDLRIKQISQETGHRNPNWFSQVFRAITGVTPNEYRARSKRSIA